MNLYIVYAAFLPPGSGSESRRHIFMRIRIWNTGFKADSDSALSLNKVPDPALSLNKVPDPTFFFILTDFSKITFFYYNWWTVTKWSI